MIRCQSTPAAYDGQRPLPDTLSAAGQHGINDGRQYVFRSGDKVPHVDPQ